MTTDTKQLEALAKSEYKWGFVSDLEADAAPPGLNEEIVRFISLKKSEPQWLLDWRLKAYRKWTTMEAPAWPNVHYPPIDYQDSRYYSAPKRDKKKLWLGLMASFAAGEKAEAVGGLLAWKARQMKDAQLSRQLTFLYHDSHRGAGDLELLLERFALKL